MGRERKFAKAMKGKDVPILILDKRWHRLFAHTGKPENIQQLEGEVNELLLKRGRLNDEIREYKLLKGKLLHNIVRNMDGTNESKENSLQSKILDKNSELVNEINVKLKSNEKEIDRLPVELEDRNRLLMQATMEFCYEQMKNNSNEIQEISQWIKSFRLELKKNVVRKKYCESSNKEIYSFMQDVFGMDILQIFDIDYKEYEALMKSDDEGV